MPKLQSVILVSPQSEMSRRTEDMDTASSKTEGAGEGAVGSDQQVDPDKCPMSWMCDRQHGYDDKMIEFWPVLHPLTDGRRATAWQLARCLLSTWHWLSATYPTSCPPAPTNMEIGRWLSLDGEGTKEDRWIEAYLSSLHCMAEAATGLSWMVEGEGMVLQASPLVQAF